MYLNIYILMVILELGFIISNLINIFKLKEYFTLIKNNKFNDGIYIKLRL